MIGMPAAIVKLFGAEIPFSPCDPDRDLLWRRCGILHFNTEVVRAAVGKMIPQMIGNPSLCSEVLAVLGVYVKSAELSSWSLILTCGNQIMSAKEVLLPGGFEDVFPQRFLTLCVHKVYLTNSQSDLLRKIGVREAKDVLVPKLRQLLSDLTDVELEKTLPALYELASRYSGWRSWEMFRVGREFVSRSSGDIYL